MNANIELLRCISGGLTEIAAKIGADASIPPGMVSEALNIKFQIDKLKDRLEDHINEAN